MSWTFSACWPAASISSAPRPASGITINTARGYVKNLYRKLGVHNQLELVAVARERGLLDASP